MGKGMNYDPLTGELYEQTSLSLKTEVKYKVTFTFKKTEIAVTAVDESEAIQKAIAIRMQNQDHNYDVTVDKTQVQEI